MIFFPIIYIYPPLCRLLDSDRDGWNPGSCISICITKFFAWSRISYALLASRRSIKDEIAIRNIAITPSPNDHDIILKLGYINQSLRYAFKPNIRVPKSIAAPM